MTGATPLGLGNQIARSLLRVETAMRRLASGHRIDRAADDPAGLGMAERMRARFVSMARAERNVQDVIGALHVGAGALDEVDALLVRMRELAVQSANGTIGDVERTALGAEFAAARSEIDRIAQSTAYGGIHLLDGSLAATAQAASPARATAAVAQTHLLAKKEKLTFEDFGVFAGLTGQQRMIDFQVGATQQAVVAAINADVVIGARIRASVDAAGRLVLDARNAQGSFRVVTNRAAAADTTGIGNTVQQADPTPGTSSGGLAVQLGIDGAPSDLVWIAIASLRTGSLGLDTASLGSAAAAQAAMGAVDTAQLDVASQRAGIGAWINRLGFAAENLRTGQTTGAEALSRIRDADLAVETSALVKDRLLFEGAVGLLRTWAGSQQDLLRLFATPVAARDRQREQKASKQR